MNNGSQNPDGIHFLFFILRFAFCILTSLMVLCQSAYAFFPDQNFMVVSGKDAPANKGDRHHQAVYFIEVDQDMAAPVHIRVFDADLGRAHDVWAPGSRVVYRLYGANGLDQTLELSRDKFYDNRWRTVATIAVDDIAKGEMVNGKRRFTYVVEGVAGENINKYQIFASSDPKENAAVPGLRLLTPFVILEAPPDYGKATQIRFDIPADAQTLNISNFSADRISLDFEALFADPVAITPSGDDKARTTEITVPLKLRGQKGAIVIRNSKISNYLEVSVSTSSASVNSKSNVPVLLELPVLLAPANRLPVPDIRSVPLADCRSVMLDAAGSRDPDGDDLFFIMRFPGGQVQEGGRVVHDFKTPGEHEVILEVRDSSKFVANGSRISRIIKINAQPKAVIQAPALAAPGENILLDGTQSKDPDGRIINYLWKFDDGERATGAQVQKRFDRVGRRQITLVVEDDTIAAAAGTGLCAQAEATHWVKVNAPPSALLQAPALWAPGEAIQLDASGSVDSDGRIVRYDWDFGDGKTGTGITVTHQWQNPGIYVIRLRVEDDSAGLSNSTAEETAQIIINAAPIPMAEYPKVAAAGATVDFSAAQSKDLDGTITDWAWDMGDGTQKQGKNIKHTYAAPGIYTVSLKVTDDTKTLNNAAETTFDVRVNHPPVPEAGEDLVVNESLVSFNAGRSFDKDDPIIDYFWKFGDGADAHGKIVHHAYAVPGTYDVRLIVTDASGVASASQSDSMRVRVNHPPIADAGGPRLVAPGESIEFDAAFSIDPDGEIAAFEWDMADGRTWFKAARTDHRFKDPGVYQVCLTVTDNDGAQGIDCAVVTVNAQPQAWFLPVPRIAPGQTVVLDGRASYDPDGEIHRAVWDFGDGGKRAEGLLVEHVFEKPGRYLVNLIVKDRSGAQNSTNRFARAIEINHQPLADMGDDLHVCRQTIAFDALASTDPDGDPLSCFWDFGDGAKGAGCRLIHSYSGPGLYPVSLTVNDGWGLSNSTDVDKAVVQINGPPEAVIDFVGEGNEAGYCAGHNVLFEGGNSSDPEKGLLRYLWDLGDGEIVESINPVRSYKKGGNYRIRLKVIDDSGLPCDTAETMRILKIMDAPIADAGDDRTVCAYEPVQFDGSGSTGGGRRIKSYEWDFGDGNFGVGVSPTHKYDQKGIYTARLVITVAGNSACGTMVEDVAQITVLGAPSAAFTAFSPGAEIPNRACPGEAIQFDAENSQPATNSKIVSYQWDFGDGTTGKGRILEHVYENTGRYTATLTIVTNTEASCDQNIHEETIVVNAQPDAVIRVLDTNGANTNLGEHKVRPYDGSFEKGLVHAVRVGTGIRLSALESEDSDGYITSYHWDFGDGKTADGPAVSHAYSAGGEYKVALRVADNSQSGCSETKARLIIQVEDPEVYPIQGPDRTCVDHEVSFSLPVDGPVQWRFSDGVEDSGNPVARQFALPGIYQVQAQYGAIWMPAASVQVMALPEIYLPETIDSFPGDVVDIQPENKCKTQNAECKMPVILEGQAFKNVYDAPGDYEARLIVQAQEGLDCLKTMKNVLVRIHPAPEAVIQVLPDPVFAGGARDAARFTVQTADDPHRWSYQWTFGDGGEAAGRTVDHLYQKAGQYEVRVILTDARFYTGRTFSFSKQIVVEKR